MAKELKSVSNGIFTLAETGLENQFYFYRNDMEIVGDAGRIPIELYKEYVIEEIINGKMDARIESKISCELSEDGIFLKITVDSNETKMQVESEKRGNFFRRVFKKR